MEKNGSLIVSWSFKGDKTDDYVLIVGTKSKGGTTKIVNAFSGDNALTLFELLTEGSEKYEQKLPVFPVP